MREGSGADAACTEAETVCIGAEATATAAEETSAAADTAALAADAAGTALASSGCVDAGCWPQPASARPPVATSSQAARIGARTDGRAWMPGEGKVHIVILHK